MNYLAHFYLSHHNEALIVGNYIADDVKGNKYLNYPKEIQEGILLHRYIDDYTDNNNLVANSTLLIRESQRKYAPVVIDLFYDHLLARYWKNYANDELLDFTQKVYRILNKHHQLLPEKSKLRLEYMEKQNWLYNYQHVEGVSRALKGLSKRTTFSNNMHCAADLLATKSIDLKADFDTFLPDIRTQANQRIKKGIIIR